MENKKKRQEELLLEAKTFFNAIKKQIAVSMRSEQNTVLLEFDQLSEFSPDLAEALEKTPEQTIIVLENALQELGMKENARIRFSNLPNSWKTKIREIRAKHLDQLISIEGIVRQTSDVRPQVVNARFECPTCGAILSVLQIERKFLEPTRCTCGWKGQFKLLSKEMVDTQRLAIEEAPDSLEGGEQPRRINVFLKEDLVDPRMEIRTTPGSRVKIFGILKEVPIPLQTGAISTRYDIAIEANNIIPLEETFEDINISDEESKEILEIAADPAIFKRLSNSIAPSIYGFNEIKEAVLLQMFGGVKKLKSDGGSTRGDMHILLVGDPGVAKSVLLKFMSSIAPKGRYVSGKAASAAGLTAAVVKDEFLKGWSLEAGAMVLANKGTVCIDEIEKMTEQDRSAMHEAMEQQCYHPDLNLIFPDNSHRKIGEFVDSLIEQNKEKVQQEINCEILPLEKEIKILTTDFESIYPKRITCVSRHIAPKELIEIKLNNGKNIIVTPEHPCWITKDGEIIAISAEKLKTGDFFPIPGELPIEGKEQTFEVPPYRNGPELCKLIGYHISDGCYELNRGKKTGIQFCNNDQLLINDYRNSIKEIFNKEAPITKRGNQFSVRVISKEVLEFINHLDKNLLEKGPLKKIPEKIMQCKTEDLALLIRALFDGDGTVVNVKRNGCRITLISENRDLADQVTEILLRFGIISSIYLDKEFYRIDISSEENIKKYYESVGFLSQKKQGRVEKYLSNTKTYRSISNVIPHSSEKIREIMKILEINQEKEVGNQICIGCNKHRTMLQKLITLAENKISKTLEAKEALENANSNNELAAIRNNLGISSLSIANSLALTSYMLNQIEKNKTENPAYKSVLLSRIDKMLSILPNLRNLKKLAFGKIHWTKIKSTKRIQNKDIKWVYDLTIDNTHSFISNNMVLHNCVTISKANIHATLRAETTVLAAGNPKLGRFDPYTPIPQQIDISPALLSRFDVLFVIRDLPNKIQDESIASHVLQEHKQEVIRDVIPQKLLRKYISYAKQKIKPKLTDEAIEEIKSFYVNLRNQSTSMKNDSGIKPIPITARQLEGIIRLSEACAKLRLNAEVSREDAKKAIEILKYSLSQVGYDEETKSFDIDKITTGITSSKRSKILILKEILSKLESQLGKLIPLENIQKEIEGKLSSVELEEAIDQLAKSGDLFKPKKGFIQRM